MTSMVLVLQPVLGMALYFQPLLSTTHWEKSIASMLIIVYFVAHCLFLCSQASMDFSLDATMKYLLREHRWARRPQFYCHLQHQLPVWCSSPYTDPEQQTPIRHPAWASIKQVIGSFHIHAHCPICFLLYSSTFVKHAGYQSGEIIETVWSTVNTIASWTRTAGKPLRNSTINGKMGDHNEKS